VAKKGSKNQSLFSDFSPTTRKEWESILERDLKGKDYKKLLSWETTEGISALPFYRLDDLPNSLHHQPDLPKADRTWQACDTIYDANPADANLSLKNAIDGGADFVRIKAFATQDAGMLGGDFIGTQLQDQKSINQLFEGIDTESIGFLFDSGMTSPALLAMIQNRDDADKILSHSRFLFDPFTYTAKHGRLPLPETQINHIVGLMADQPAEKTLAVNGAHYYNSGATIVQELGITLAIASEFLARIPEKDRVRAAKNLFFHLSAGMLYFPEIAKIRAARLLWKNILEGYDLDTEIPITIHSQTTGWNKTIADAHNNMLRSTTEAMSAVLGGTNMLVVDPFDAHVKEPDQFSRRIARNVNHILAEEAHFAKVADPAAGSYYIEKLTDQIAEKAWDYFRLIENQGGFINALEANIIQREITRSAEKKNLAVATRKIALTGTNDVPNIEDRIPDKLFYDDPVDSLRQTKTDVDIDKDSLMENFQSAFANGASTGDLISHLLSPQKLLYKAVKPYRASIPFEKMRLRTQQENEKNGVDYTAALVPVGRQKMRKARAGFAENYLQTAGITAHNHPGFSSVDDAKKEISGDHQIVVLCSSDKEYSKLVEPFCNAFSGNDKIRILAGNPGDNEEEYRKAGIDYFIYSGSNMVEILGDIQHHLFENSDS